MTNDDSGPEPMDKEGRSDKNFARAAAAIAILGLIVSAIGTGMQGAEKSSGIGVEESAGATVRFIGMSLILTACIGYVARSVGIRNAKKWDDFRKRQLKWAQSIERGVPLPVASKDRYSHSRGRPLIVAARICGGIWAGLALLYFVVSVFQLFSHIARYGSDSVSIWYQLIVMVLLVPIAIGTISLLMFCLAEILAQLSWRSFAQSLPSSDSSKDTAVTPKLE